MLLVCVFVKRGTVYPYKDNSVSVYLTVECKFYMGLKSVDHTTVWRMLSGPTPVPPPSYFSFQHMAVNRWITWSQFTCCLKGVNELMTQSTTKHKQVDYLVTGDHSPDK